jgi:hypothetical protein
MHSLCTDLRLQPDRLARRRIPAVHDRGWVPSAVFHLSGDFQTNDGYSKNLISVLLTRKCVRTNSEGEESVLGMHCFLHVCDGECLAQGFDEVLHEYEASMWLRRADATVSAEVPTMLEVCTAAAVGSWGDGEAEVGEEDWIGVKIMDQLEGILWGLWLAMDCGKDESARGIWNWFYGKSM